MNSEWAETPQQQPQGNLALAGAQLKAQREALGWPVEQVADQLKLAPRQVIALEEGDMAALPNLAVVRGFVRAYAKVVRLDAAPLVAMIEVHPAPAQQDPAAPVRREISATFSESRFPSMTQRSSNQTPLWIAGAVAVVVAAAFGAYKLGYVPASLLSSQAGKETAHAEVGPVETTLIKPGQDLTPVQSPSVPLISVPPPGNDTQTGAPAAVASAPAAAVVPPAAATAPAATPAVTPPAAAAAVGANALVLKVEQDSWVEIRRPGSTPLISRMVKAGSTETFDITGPATLVVGKPGVVQATLRGAKLDLPTVAGGTISRVSIK
ncbi:Cytoskeleton protein rodZ [Janthinobacterium lividum]|nr:RodZ domain-containing protein [Janthinobacterium lividum]MCC7711678.1 helix-turn-helix domain-containing protein [Janthinobacterium lividum]OEZ64312.1 cytoskeleton protein RodZ [Janthinobacterium lividum]STQ98532.1 Cytoskeleton protein rodZ [Janthinobacterium lividum]